MVNNLGVSAMRWVISALLLVLALGGGVVSGGATSQAAAQAVAEATPAQLEGVRVVTPDELRPLLKQGVTVYDLRTKASYVDGHVPSAASAAAHYDPASAALATHFPGPAPGHPPVIPSPRPP